MSWVEDGKQIGLKTMDKSIKIPGDVCKKPNANKDDASKEVEAAKNAQDNGEVKARPNKEVSGVQVNVADLDCKLTGKYNFTHVDNVLLIELGCKLTGLF